MRVVAGKARGMRLKGPKGRETRPTSDRIKEALFSMIAFDIENARFLDLFSGSGGIGIESLSRGAKEAIFVEKSKASYETIKSNLDKTKLQNKAKLVNSSAKKALVDLGRQGEQFDIVFMDPPYNENMVNSTIKLIFKNNILAPKGYIIIERAPKEEIEASKDFIVFKEKQYKTTVISFLKGNKK